MFLETSRYFNLPQVSVTNGKGGTVSALTLRRLPGVVGQPTVIRANDRLDILAQQRYDNPTQYWRIADANTELQANALVDEVGRVIGVPEP